MTIDAAAQILARRYEQAPRGNKVTQLYLFGIQYAEHIGNFSMAELAVRAGLSKSMGAELNKAVNLAEFVRMK
ncbi:MAG: hypothetical protein KIS86_13290 [Devosia sp.]|nr:hypothetical protein [Devosia sp.]